ncbi:MAG: hypothetical protein HY063_06115 [Bacteroidetes bacterium]|nr:hypothetical protein [Bacteroidota bacterium]
MGKNKYHEQQKAAQDARKKKKPCRNKAAYKTEEEAYQEGQRTYHCPHCGKWHRSGSLATLMSDLKKKKKRKRKL